jgi:aryl-alcohol dehydrogenase-like predicted oxidoreductase
MTSESKRDNAEIEYLATPFKLSRIALGTWAIGSWMWGGTDETAAIAVIHEAVDRGVTLIDTAPAYGFGRSEEIVGKALAENGLRRRVVIATRSVLTGRTASRSPMEARRVFVKRLKIH